MKKALIIMFVLVSIGVLLANSLIKDIKKEVKNGTDKYEKYIGEKYVLENDTLTIINYSVIKDNFTLSNGKEVNSKLIFKNYK